MHQRQPIARRPRPTTANTTEPALISKRHRSGIDICLQVRGAPCGPHDVGMSKVVERGLARCPRCVSVADYVFIETGPSGALRYEVRCRKCGECYGEDSRPLTLPPAVVAAEPPIEWPPDREPVPERDWRSEVRERVSVAVRVGRSEVDDVARRTLTWVLEQRLRRSGRVDHTGG